MSSMLARVLLIVLAFLVGVAVSWFGSRTAPVPVVVEARSAAPRWSPEMERTVDLLERAWGMGSQEEVRTLLGRLRQQVPEVVWLLDERVRASGDPRVRDGLVDALGRLRHLDCVEVLKKLYFEEAVGDVALGERIVSSLMRLGGDISVEALLEIYRKGQDRTVTGKALDAVVVIGDARHIPWLREAAAARGGHEEADEVERIVRRLEEKETARLAWAERK